MQRKTIPRAIKETVLKEFNHHCAICGKVNPHVHHIDDNPENNDPQNLLPLCPNCHLLDHHNPTVAVDPKKLSLFRQFKDPLILSPEFHPLFMRLRFLLDLGRDSFNTIRISAHAHELIDFVSQLKMGSFYGPKIKTLAEKRAYVRLWGIDTPDSVFEQWDNEENQEYLEKLTRNRDAIIEQVIELLRYQPWERTRPSNNG